jgi:hypothetical protein
MTCSKIFSGDLPEITNEIIQYFQNDCLTLHSCILVNRLWCRLAIPLLWEDPFSIKIPKIHRFIAFYLHKLNDDDKIKLNEYGINSDLFSSNTLFNYFSFIKCLKTQRISSVIMTWAKNAITLPSYHQYLKLSGFIFLSLFKVFIENKVNLYTFEIDVYSTLKIIGRDCFNSTFQLILQNPNFTCNIKDLKLCIYGCIDSSSFINCFCPNCNTLLSLYINYFGNNYPEKDLTKLINSQQNLKKILLDSLYPLKNLKNSNCSNTLKTIIFHKIWLDELEITFINEMFEQLNVLESIHIFYCYPLSSIVIQQFINLTKPFKLKSLFINEDSFTQIEPLILLLQKSGNYLENFGIKLLKNKMNNELKLQLFKIVKLYCNKIKFINLTGFYDQNIFSVFDLIKNIQQNLNYLTISSILSDDNDTLSSTILQNLGQVLPYRLEYLSLVLKININDLEVFFKNTQNIYIRKLLIRNNKYQGSEDILPYIKKYIMKEKRVKYLAIEEHSISFDNNEKIKDLFNLKDEVEEFKFYDIQITNYNDLCIEDYDFMNKL